MNIKKSSSFNSRWNFIFILKRSPFYITMNLHTSIYVTEEVSYKRGMDITAVHHITDAKTIHRHFLNQTMWIRKKSYNAVKMQRSGFLDYAELPNRTKRKTVIHSSEGRSDCFNQEKTSHILLFAKCGNNQFRNTANRDWPVTVSFSKITGCTLQVSGFSLKF